MKMFPKVVAGAVGITAALALSVQAQVIVDPNYGGPFTANPITTTSGPGGTSGVDQGWAPFGAVSVTSPTYNGAPTSMSLALAANDGWATPGAYQIDTGVTPGQLYTFSVWANQTASFTSAGGLVQLGFVQPSNLGGISTVENPGNTVGIVVNGTVDAWTQYSVSATAPAGYTDAIVYLMAQDNLNPNPVTIYYDGAAITAVPEPASLALLALGLPLFFIRRRK